MREYQRAGVSTCSGWNLRSAETALTFQRVTLVSRLWRKVAVHPSGRAMATVMTTSKPLIHCECLMPIYQHYPICATVSSSFRHTFLLRSNNAGCSWDGGDCCGPKNYDYCKACKCLDCTYVVKGDTCVKDFKKGCGAPKFKGDGFCDGQYCSSVKTKTCRMQNVNVWFRKIGLLVQIPVMIFLQ